MITNAQYYRKSYAEARFAFECYCLDCLQKRCKMCLSDASCDLCQSRWERLPWSRKAHDDMIMQAAAGYMKLPFPTNEESDDQLRACGLLEGREEYPDGKPGDGSADVSGNRGKQHRHRGAFRRKRAKSA